MGWLSVRYEPDDAWMGRLSVRIEAAPFGGEGSGWCNPDEVKDFAKALMSYPLPEEAPPTLDITYGGSTDGSRPPRTPVHLVIKPHGRTGALVVQATLEAEPHEALEGEPPARVVAWFSTSYMPVERFARRLAQAMLDPAAGKPRSPILTVFPSRPSTGSGPPG